MASSTIRARETAAAKAKANAPATTTTTGGLKGETRTRPGYTFEDVARHDAPDDAWCVVHDVVYDITHWISKHPGGSIPLRQYAGRDMTDAFNAYHGPSGKAARTLRAYAIGDLVDPASVLDPVASDASSDDGIEFQEEGAEEVSEVPVSPKKANGAKVREEKQRADYPDHVGAFRELVAGLEDEFHTDYAHYFKLAAFLVTLLSGAFYCVLGYEGEHGVAVRALGACLLGLFWQQSMFIGHDAGHGAITHDHRRDFLVGLVVGNLCNGVGITWWTTTHNVHHVACNSLECDPDIQHMPIIAVTPKYFKSVWSLYHNRRMPFDAAARWLVSKQHYTFYPIMAVARFNLYAQSIILLLTSKEITLKRRTLELAVMGAYFAWLAALVSAVPSGWERLGFLLLSHAVGGVIHVQICLSHFSRNIFEGRPENGKWVEMQLSGTMDIDCPRYMDWFHGGLQFQTEHHLVPRMPRHKLRRFREETLRPWLKAHGLTMDAPTFWEANREVWCTLRNCAREARLSPAFVHAVNLEG